MARGRKRRGRNLTLDKFFGLNTGSHAPAQRGNTGSSKEQVVSKHDSGTNKPLLKDEAGTGPSEAVETHGGGVDLAGGLSDILSLIEEGLSTGRSRAEKFNAEDSSLGGQVSVEAGGSSVTGLEVEHAEQEPIINIDSSIIPTGRILDELLEKGLGTMDVKCNENGECSDGLRIGDIYVDKYGFKRQRGYIITTRIPVYTDWIVEEAVLKKILPKAHKLVTNRGAVALVPDDYLCTLQERWGVILKNYDKCKNKPTLLNTYTEKT